MMCFLTDLDAEIDSYYQNGKANDRVRKTCVGDENSGTNSSFDQKRIDAKISERDEASSDYQLRLSTTLSKNKNDNVLIVNQPSKDDLNADGK